MSTHKVHSLNYSKHQLFLTKPRKSYIKYTFVFTSLITPHKLTNVRLLNNSRAPFRSSKTNKLFVKQSYLLMTWLWYLQKSHLSSKKPSFAFKPTRVSRTTITKAPMAHKTFSQEQLQFKFFNLIIKLTLPTNKANSILTINQSLYLLLQLKNSIPFVETNLFLLKRFNLILPVKDTRFLTL